MNKKNSKDIVEQVRAKGKQLEEDVATDSQTETDRRAAMLARINQRGK